MESVITVKYKDRVKTLPYEGKNVYALERQIGSSILHNSEKDGTNRKAVKPGSVKAYIDGMPAEDGDVPGLGQTLEFSEVPLTAANY